MLVNGGWQVLDLSEQSIRTLASAISPGRYHCLATPDRGIHGSRICCCILAVAEVPWKSANAIETNGYSRPTCRVCFLLVGSAERWYFGPNMHGGYVPRPQASQAGMSQCQSLHVVKSRQVPCRNVARQATPSPAPLVPRPMRPCSPRWRIASH